MYSLGEYGWMINDSARTDAYALALRQAIHPGCVVLDIGTGAGIFALLACRYGAGRVYAIEVSDVIELARQIARANQLEDRITFVQDVSTRVELPEKADVIIADLHGVLPLAGGLVPAIADARRRLLAPGGILIPQRDILWGAVVEAPDLYQRRYARPWQSNDYDLDMRVARPKVVSEPGPASFKPEQLLTEPRSWATLDFMQVEDPNVRANVAWTVQRAGTGHGLITWFDAVMASGGGYSNGPGQPACVHGILFLPWSEPVALTAGNRVTATLQATLVGEHYHWTWVTTVRDPDHPEPARAHFEQSSFFGILFSPRQLHRRAGSHVPTLGADGQVDRFILAQMSGQASLETIARRVALEFPGRFASAREALDRVGDLSAQYSDG
jgi:protein arginine N-methyltransferase 1